MSVMGTPSGAQSTPAYDDEGVGTAVVCSHGMLMDRTMYAPQVETLSASYRLVAYDSRARGTDWAGPYSLYDLAADCELLLDQLSIDRCVLVGMSMGGFMALRFALTRPERLCGLVLVGASAKCYDEDERATWHARYAPLRDRETMGLEAAMAEAEYCFAPRWRQDNPREFGSWLDKWAAIAGGAVYWEAASWIDQDDVGDRLSEAQVPALVIHGSVDSAVDIGDAAATATALGAELVELPDVGHTPNLERPDAFSDALSRFLGELD